MKALRFIITLPALLPLFLLLAVIAGLAGVFAILAAAIFDTCDKITDWRDGEEAA